MNVFRNQFTRLISPFRRLQWRLTFSYTLVSTGALLVVELLLFAVLFIFLGSDLLTSLIVQAVHDQLLPEAQQYLEQSPPDIDGLRSWTETLVEIQTQISPRSGIEEITTLHLGNIRLNAADEQLYVLSPEMTVWANVPGQSETINETLEVSQLEIAQAVAIAALGEGVYSHQLAGGVQIISAPIRAENEDLLGFIVLTYRIPLLEPDLITPILQVIGITLIPFTLATALVGTIFGFLTSRGLTRRIE
jgi:hypothetical protein